MMLLLSSFGVVMFWFLTNQAYWAVYGWKTHLYHQKQWSEWFEFCRANRPSVPYTR